MANMATNRSDILFAETDQQPGAHLVGLNGDDLLFANATRQWSADLVDLNGSGADGIVSITQNGAELTVNVNATGLEPNRTHPMHIHGETSPEGQAVASDLGAAALFDSDADGFVELGEASDGLGPVLLPITNQAGSFPLADATGAINFTATYDLSQIDLPRGVDVADLFPMELRSVVVHGVDVDAGAGALTGGEVDGTGGYKQMLPAAAGAIRELTTEPTGVGEISVLRGDNGNDQLFGGDGTDILLGGRGNDHLAGFGGDDVLVGGSGRDTFVIAEGNDQIADFEPRNDKIHFLDDDPVSAVQTEAGVLLSAGEATALLVGLRTGAATGAEVDAQGWLV